MGRGLAAICLGLWACGGGVPEDLAGSDAAPSPWQPMAPMPVAVQETAVVAFEERIWVVGGFEAEAGETDAVRIYDPASDTWSSGPPLPAPAHHIGAAVHDGRLYLLGTLRGIGFTAFGASYRLAADEQSWESLPDMPMGTQRGAGTVVAVDDRLFVFGGLRGGQAVSDVSAFVPATNSWTELLAPLPEARDHLVGAAAADGVLVIGGRDGTIDAIRGRVDRYDPATDRWSAATPMLTPRAGCAAGLVGDRIVVVGGEGAASASGVFAEAEAYDPATDTWSSLPPMPTPRHGMGAATVGNVLYVPGGADVRGFSATAVSERIEL